MRAPWLAVAVLVAGCVDAEPARPGQSSAGPWTATSPDLPGVELSGTRFSEDGRHRIEAHARNFGSQPYVVAAICQSPWSERFAGPGGEPFAAREPQVRCLALGWAAFLPGDALSVTLWWNETHWNRDAERLEEAPRGLYAWTVSFEARRDESSQPARLELRFPVVVG